MTLHLKILISPMAYFKYSQWLRFQMPRLHRVSEVTVGRQHLKLLIQLNSVLSHMKNTVKLQVAEAF